jgi:hypothetical protein
MKKALVIVTTIILLATIGSAAEKRPLKDVDTDSFTTDTQVSPKGAGDNHVAIVWWIPNEFWKSILSRDTTTSEADKKSMLDAMAGISLLAIVQADISSFGAFSFYSKEKIEQTMKISCAGSDGKQHTLEPLKQIAPDLKVVLGVFKPVLGAAMGNLGNNMHFYVLSDTTLHGNRLLDPYRKGHISVKLTRSDKAVMDSSIEMPINALFVPRKCPNGKEAHISWKFCPWSGKQLSQ